jgi:hypothetical protein
VVKPVDGSGGKGIVIGPRASPEELDALRRRVLEDPRGWIAQPVVQLSTVPTLIDDDLRPRHVDLRPFAVNDGDDVWVLPGGLTRVALPEGELVVNSSQGGGSKDTWVLSPAAHRPPAPQPEEAPPTAIEADAIEQEQPKDHHGSGPTSPSPAAAPAPPAAPAPARRSQVPLTVAALPVAVMPKRVHTQRQEEQQQQAVPRAWRADSC